MNMCSIYYISAELKWVLRSMADGGRDLMRSVGCAGLGLVLLTQSAFAGPPYVSDDPEPTDYQHFEIYTFTTGTTTRDGTTGQSGIDFNYGAAPDLQLTATLPAGFDRPAGGGSSVGLSNVELAAKYRFLHQDLFGLDVSVFPRIFLPSGVEWRGRRPCVVAAAGVG